MGNTCECVCRQTDDDAEDALLAGFEGEMTDSSGQPRGPPPPYQVHHTSPQSNRTSLNIGGLCPPPLPPSPHPQGNVYWFVFI